MEPKKKEKKYWKKIIKTAIVARNEKDLKQKMNKLSKLELMKNENFEERDYLNKMNMHDARLHFRIRTKTIKCKMNQPSDRFNKENLWRCPACGNIDTQKHIKWCPAFKELREGRSLNSDSDLVGYFKDVLKIREKYDW